MGYLDFPFMPAMLGAARCRDARRYCSHTEVWQGVRLWRGRERTSSKFRLECAGLGAGRRTILLCVMIKGASRAWRGDSICRLPCGQKRWRVVRAAAATCLRAGGLYDFGHFPSHPFIKSYLISA
eukprot:365349-Chlamydomonas_euryale.AAC.1